MDLEDLKALGAIVLTGALEHLAHNPIGSMTALVGLLYIYQKWQTQRLERKKLENQLKSEEEEKDKKE